LKPKRSPVASPYIVNKVAPVAPEYTRALPLSLTGPLSVIAPASTSANPSPSTSPAVATEKPSWE
jgi:hypothetical protein